MARLGLPTIGPCHTAFGFSTSGTALSLGIRRSVWEALTAAERAIIEACCTEEFHRSLALARTSEATARAALAAAGTTFDSLPSGVLSGFAAAADEVVATLGRGGREARKIHANYMEFKRGLSPGPLTARPAGATDNAVMARNRALTM
jgi:TRAP-type mannitol/chloroaromatic compound transport system substrate-binding protein